MTRLPECQQDHLCPEERMWSLRSGGLCLRQNREWWWFSFWEKTCSQVAFNRDCRRRLTVDSQNWDQLKGTDLSLIDLEKQGQPEILALLQNTSSCRGIRRIGTTLPVLSLSHQKDGRGSWRPILNLKPLNKIMSNQKIRTDYLVAIKRACGQWASTSKTLTVLALFQYSRRR